MARRGRCWARSVPSEASGRPIAPQTLRERRARFWTPHRVERSGAVARRWQEFPSDRRRFGHQRDIGRRSSRSRRRWARFIPSEVLDARSRRRRCCERRASVLDAASRGRGRGGRDSCCPRFLTPDRGADAAVSVELGSRRRIARSGRWRWWRRRQASVAGSASSASNSADDDDDRRNRRTDDPADGRSPAEPAEEPVRRLDVHLGERARMPARRSGSSTEPAIVGRARGATVRCDDPGLEPHHALLVPDGASLRVLQLTGRAAAHRRWPGGRHRRRRHRRPGPRRDRPQHVAPAPRRGRRAAGRPPPRHRRAAHPAPGPDVGSDPTDTAADRHRRSARAAVGWCPRCAPSALRRCSPSCCASRCSCCSARSAASSPWAVGRRSASDWRRRRRTSRRDGRTRLGRGSSPASPRSRAAFVEHISTTASTAASAMAIAATHDHRLWERRGTHADAFVVGLGTGELRWRPPVDGAPAAAGPMVHVARHADQPPPLVTDTWLRDQPVSVDLGPGSRLAVRGPIGATTAVARSIVLQLAANLGPADVRVLIVSEHLDRWRWAADLPHTAGPDGATLLTTPLDAATELAALQRPGRAAPARGDRRRRAARGAHRAAAPGHRRRAAPGAAGARRTRRGDAAGVHGRAARADRGDTAHGRRRGAGSPTSHRARCPPRCASPASARRPRARRGTACAA